MTGREAPNGDPLDRIEAVLESWGERDWMPTWRDDGFVPQLLALVAVARAAREVTAKQQECLENLRSHGIVFNDIGNDPTNWQHVAFTIYSDLCEAEAGCRAALARLEEPR